MGLKDKPRNRTRIVGKTFAVLHALDAATPKLTIIDIALPSWIKKE